MILGCLITILVFIFVLVILTLTGVGITLNLLAKILIPFVLIVIGTNVINKSKK